MARQRAWGGETGSDGRHFPGHNSEPVDSTLFLGRHSPQAEP